MKKSLLVSLLMISSFATAFAGGIVTNYNNGAHYCRKIALNGTTSIDGVYYNPAGIVHLENGWHFTLGNQTVVQTYYITSDYPTLNGVSENNPKEYQGDVFAPIYPNFYAAWKKDKLAVSFAFNIVGGGGSAEYPDGLPSFEQPVSMIPAMLSSFEIPNPLVPGTTIGLPTTGYKADISFQGSSVYYGGQIGASYAVTDWFSAFAGARYVYAYNTYEGDIKNIQINPKNEAVGMLLNMDGMPLDGSYVSAPGFFNALAETELAAALPEQITQMLHGYAAQTSDKTVDAVQTASGITPIVGVNFNLLDKKLNIGATYEFKTDFVFENDTDVDDTGMFPDGEEKSADIPAFFRVGAEYALTDDLRISLGYNQYFETDVDWEGRQDRIDHGLYEILAGIEYDINDKLFVSAGYSNGTTGVKPEYQQDMSFSLSSNNFGFGGGYHINDKYTVSIGGLYTVYGISEVETPGNEETGTPAYTTTFDKDTFIIGLGFDVSL